MKTISWYENCDSTKNYGRIRAQDPKNVNDLELLAKIKILAPHTTVRPQLFLEKMSEFSRNFYSRKSSHGKS